MSSLINELSLLLEISKNHFKVESVFSHWLKWSSEISFLMIFLMISLLKSGYFAQSPVYGL